jgi:ankyrin repeat protein
VTALLLAFWEDAHDEAEALIRAGAEVNTTAKRKDGLSSSLSCLEHAVNDDRVRLAELLIDRGARLESSHYKHLTLLSLAKSEKMAELLIRSGLDPRLPNENGTTPFDRAVEEGRRGVVVSLLRHGVAATFFAHAVLGDIGRVAGIIDQQPDLLFAANVYDTPPQPASESSIDGVEIPWGSYGGTALHYAVKGGSHALVRYLLKRGADVNAATRAGWTPLHDAVYHSIYNDLREGQEIIRTLVVAGADLNAQTIGGYRPLRVAEYLNSLSSCSDLAPGFIDLLIELQGQ